jgi:hypothetical protein
MAFRVLIAGGRHFTDFPTLRVTLDALLANRLPDVELLTTGGPGVPMLAASYATERGLRMTALVPDFRRFPVDAVERRDAFLVSAADAAVVVWDERTPELRRVLALVARRRLPVHVIGDHHEPAVDQTGVDATSELEGHMIMAYTIAR